MIVAQSRMRSGHANEELTGGAPYLQFQRSNADVVISVSNSAELAESNRSANSDLRCPHDRLGAIPRKS